MTGPGPEHTRAGADALQLDGDLMRRLGHEMVDRVVDRWIGLREDRAWGTADRTYTEARLREAAPETGRDPDEVIDRVVRDVLPYAGRIDHAWRARADVSEGVPDPPTSYLKRFFFDTMVFEPDQVKFLVDKYGADHVLLGTDYPYDMGDDDPLQLIGSVPGLDQSQIDLIAGGNAARLLGYT